MALLGELYQSGCGLPIGFEGSAPLANLYLTPLDQMLTTSQIPFVRWTDDVDYFTSDLGTGRQLLLAAADCLAPIGLRLNAHKIDVLEKGPEAEARLFDPGRASIVGGPDCALSRLAVESWMADLGSAEMSGAHFRACMNTLRKHRDPRGVEFLEVHPDWLVP